MTTTAKSSCHFGNKEANFAHDLLHTGLSGECVIHLLGFYRKSHSWPQLRRLILGFHFTEVAHAYCGPGRSGMPSKLVLFRFVGIILGVTGFVSQGHW